MEDCNDIFINSSEFIKDRLYFVTLQPFTSPPQTPNVHYFSIENQLVYENFYSDFGPLNISMLYHYCMKLNKKLNCYASLEHKRIVHMTRSDEKERVNAAVLIGSYSIIYLNFEPSKAYEILTTNNREEYIEFRDASIGDAYTISLMDCLNGVYKAYKLGFFDFSAFNSYQYEHYERVENGDLNWIVPGKFVGFCGPQSKSKFESSYSMHSPEFYFKYFKKNNVTCIIRLNKKAYDSNKFVNAGFTHYDLYFVDGSTPTDKILTEFLNICEKTDGGIAVHCKAGLGRTGTLIGCYLMKHYQFTAHEAIAWIRICRPGSVIGHQQMWLEGKETQMWKDGDSYRKKRGITITPKHKHGIYYKHVADDIKTNIDDNDKPKEIKINDKVTRILKRVDTMKLNDKDDKNENVHGNKLIDSKDDKIDDLESSITQGDKLKAIKARRQSQASANLTSRVLATSLETSITRGSKLLSTGLRAPHSSHSRVLSKRNDGDDVHVGSISTRRSLLRKPTITKTATTVGKTKVVQKKKENGWTLEQQSIVKTIDACNGDNKKEIKTIKRGKRSLTLEKDKTNSPRSVKVLRRSHTQVSTNETDVKPRAKVTLTSKKF